MVTVIVVKDRSSEGSRVLPLGAAELPACEHLTHVVLKDVVHEGIYERICHIVAEVQVEHGGVVFDQSVCHNPGGNKGYHEHQRNGEQHQGSSNIGRPVLLPQPVGVVAVLRLSPSSFSFVPLYRVSVFVPLVFLGWHVAMTSS